VKIVQDSERSLGRPTKHELRRRGGEPVKWVTVTVAATAAAAEEEKAEAATVAATAAVAAWAERAAVARAEARV
jgi:hypothetical protein